MLNLPVRTPKVLPQVEEIKKKTKRVKKEGAASGDDTKKKKTCKDCRNFEFYKNIDENKFKASAMIAGQGASKTLAFVLSPLDWENLDKLQWRIMLSAHFSEYNIIFVPYPRCYRHAFDPKIATPGTHKICAYNFVRPILEQHKVDLVIVTPATKDLIEAAGGRPLDFPGNWSNFYGRPVFFAKSFWNILKKCFDNNSLVHCKERVTRFFNNTLAWQANLDFKVVNTVKELWECIAEINQQEDVAIDVETSGLDPNAPDFVLKTIGIYWPKKARCFPWDLPEGLDKEYREVLSDFIKTLAADKNFVKVAHHLKFEQKVFIKVFGIQHFEKWEDTMFMSYLTDENRASNSLKYLAGDYEDGYMDRPENFATATLQDLWHYNCLDCFYTYRLRVSALAFRNNVKPDLIPGLEYVYHEVMLPLSEELAHLELIGCKIDYDYLIPLQDKLKKELEELRAQIDAEYPQMVGKDIESPQQLAGVLFVMLGYPVLKENKTGPSVDAHVLKDLEELHGCALAGLVRKYKKKVKQLSTFVEPYVENRAGYYGDRVRTSYMQVKNNTKEFSDESGTGTVTGRLCIHGDTILETSYGPIAIKDLDLERYPDCKIRTHTGEWQRILRRIYKGQEEMFRIICEGGNLICTSGHRIGTDRGWRRVGEITRERIRLEDIE